LTREIDRNLKNAVTIIITEEDTKSQRKKMAEEQQQHQPQLHSAVVGGIAHLEDPRDRAERHMLDKPLQSSPSPTNM
jgi:hypothetical protein